MEEKKDMFDAFLEQMECGNPLSKPLSAYRFHKLTGLSSGAIQNLKKGKSGYFITYFCRLAAEALAGCSKKERRRLARKYLGRFEKEYQNKTN